ncbi:glycosyl transferase [Gaetbulibacter sp. 4G1]|nr:glycosyltransferase [Gaetbulibacter sp. 4G1]PIA77993.1 glycosyl transferase [Gaetbulibacter sp. 4G1]
MRFLIISHVVHKPNSSQWFGYGPYVREMNLWLKYVDEVEIVAPKENKLLNDIDLTYKHNNIRFTKVPAIAFVDIKSIIISLLSLPQILYKLLIACKRADHIHLRCPGNIGLLGCLVQILFPKKIKTAKYAGNWNPKSKQPLSYKLQKKILSNTFLTKNITTLVYGDWPKQTKNIKSFFTASFKDSDKEEITIRNYKNQLKFIFIGSLVSGKSPDLAIKIIESLIAKGFDISLQIFGEGILRNDLEDYIKTNKLTSHISLEGNKSIEVIKKTLKTSHFLLLPSKSEGWPKAVAEAMFFGVIPISTSISCIPYMLDNSKRGILIDRNLENAVLKIVENLESKDLNKMSKLASDWSQKFTLDYFESEIKKLLIH